MKVIRTCIICLGIFISNLVAYSQFQNTDSLEKKLLEKNLSDQDRVKVLLELSDEYLSPQPNRAGELAFQAYVVSKKINDNDLMASSLRSIGNYYSFEGEYDSCIYYLKRSIHLNPDDPLPYFYLGQNEWYNGTEDSCENYYKQAEIRVKKNNDFKSLAAVYYSLADYYRYTQRYSIAQEYITWSIKILEKSTLYSDLATAYNIQAEVYRMKGDYKNALETYVKTARIAYNILDSTRIGYCFSRMGYIYYMQNNFDLAERFLIRALDIGEKIERRNLILFSLKALTDMFSNRADEKKCRYYAEQCLKKGTEMHDEPSISLAYSSLSNLYYRIGNPDSADLYANKAYDFAKANSDPVNMANAILNKIPIEFDKGNFSKVIKLTTEGIEVAKYTQTMEHLRDLYKFRYRAYEKLNNKEAYFIAFDTYRMYEDSLSNQDVDLQVKQSELEMNYQDKHLQDTLVYIEKAQQAKQEILLRKQQSTYSIVIGAIVTVLLLVIIFIVVATSRKRKLLNLSLAQSNHEKELLLKEIHHRVKNSLQVVSSLLNLQKSNAERKNFSELINESQIKINNIAIVHELLYQSSTFNSINLTQYIDKLCAHIMQTLSNREKSILIEKDVEDIQINLENSVPLALVVNEIITNSVKYAFVNRTDGVISVSIKMKFDTVEVKISDNGRGLPEEMLNSSSGIGITLIKGFVKQLKGELKYGNNKGCFFVFSFPYNQSK